ncbi:response regulator [Amycolatopsis coloradensis]|uniref:Response regulator n=1 Tax=Amycolatopsis coloradensis TaxID=76021 RepID=A0A1R0KZ76_9PSEU|nr:GAF domain-containing protein [Amycolatopsis coloradensis]OLZ54661.1 response regulator [Amycolatopsis coloradensis]
MSRHRRSGGDPGTLAPDLTGALAAITTRLVGTPDNATVLRLITEMGTELLGATSTGVLLARAGGGLDVVAASDERVQFLESLQTEIDQGPCVDCIALATLVTSPDLAAKREKWPNFVPAALAAGYRSAVAVPMKLDGRAVGGFNLFYGVEVTLEQWQLELAQVVSDLAVLALVQERGDRRADRFLEARVTALNDRAQYGQAVGLVAGTLDLDPSTASAAILDYVADHGSTLREVTGAITDGSLRPADLVEGR